jgi:hypothetical protein
MLFNLGRFLQMLGLLITPAGIAGNLLRPKEIEVKMTLAIAALGIIVFVFGWLIQQAARPK